MHNSIINIIAMAGTGSGGSQTQGPGFMIIWLLIMVALFYFILIRPQQRKEKERRRMIEQIKSGNKVIFAGGMIGVITNVKDKVFTIKIAENTKVDVLRESVTRVLEEDKNTNAQSKEKSANA
jgi:preprotein translocase subunit YajC